jgi:error-prone DNA polymerase
LQDVLTCIREKCTIHNAGFLLHKNSERYLKPIDEMLRLFRHYPDAIKRTLELSEACQFTLDSLNYTTPDELADDGKTLQEKLTGITWRCANEKYGGNIPEKIITNIKHELRFIEQMNYAYFFLQVYDFVCFAKQQIFFSRGEGQPLIPVFAIAWELPLLILKSLNYCLKDLFRLKDMNRRTSMLILNMSEERR